MRRRIPGGLVAAVVAAGLLAGCTTTVRGTGTPPPDAERLVTDAVDGLAHVGTGFGLSVSLTQGSRTFEVSSRAQGDNGTGTVTVDGEKADLISVDGTGYVKSSARFWTGYVQLDPDVADGLAGRWVELGGTATNLEVYVSQPAISQSLETFPDSGFRLVRRVASGGVAAWELAIDDGGAVAVSSGRPTRLLQFGGALGRYTFTYPTDQVSVTAPDDPLPYPG